VKISLLLLLLLTSLASSAEAVGLPRGDLNGDCIVNLNDVLLFTGQWLDNAGCSGLGCADIDGDNNVDSIDFAMLAAHWYERGKPLVINEFMASNSSTPADPNGDFPDWIEIYNVSSQQVNLKDWYLTDDAYDLNKWEFPAMQLQAGAYLLVFATNKDLRDPCSPLHTNFKLGAGGEYLALVQPDGNTAHEYAPRYPQQCTDISYGLVPELDMPVFFINPTPGAENGLGTEELGPIIRDVKHTPQAPLDSNDIVVTAKITEAFAPVDTSSIKLHYRVMFGSEPNVTMYDDGAHSDGTAGDDVYGASIAAAVSGLNDMVRWRVTAKDTNNVSSRWPLFPYPDNSPEYLGTIINDPSPSSALPILHWFVEDTAAADTWTGTRAALFFEDNFYDNVFVRIRGGTSSSLEKKNHKFVFNRGHYFLFSKGQIRVEEANINAAYVDTSYMREILSQELSTKAGVPSCYTFPLRLEQNGAFHSLAVFVEQVDDRFLERHGLDPDGSLYKAAINDTVFDNAYDFEAKNGSDYSDMVDLVDGLNLSGSERTRYIFDNLNITLIYLKLLVVLL
jgi:hypothetical protein